MHPQPMVLDSKEATMAVSDVEQAEGVALPLVHQQHAFMQKDCLLAQRIGMQTHCS